MDIFRFRQCILSRRFANTVADTEFSLFESVTVHGLVGERGLNTAPHLREITTQTMDVKLPINLSQLTASKLMVPPWSLTYISLSDIAFILKLSPHLVSCHLEIPLRDWVSTGDLSSKSLLSLPALENQSKKW